MTRKALGWGLGGALALLVGMHFIPVEMANPPESAPLPLPEGDVGRLLSGACMDCHSHRTEWPWYARVAPVKFLIADHVSEGRRKLNFSTWGSQEPSRRARKLEEIAELVGEGEMPPVTYAWMHPAARLTDAQRDALVAWARRERGER